MTPELLMGVGFHDAALLLMRVVIGAFFVLYRHRWFYDCSRPKGSRLFCVKRRSKLRARLRTCGYPRELAPLVATTQVLAGMGLIVGLLTVPAALAIFFVMVFANCCAPKEEIAAMKPVDKIDWWASYLRLVEPLYLTNALVVLSLGPGKYSLDYLLLEYIR